MEIIFGRDSESGRLQVSCAGKVFYKGNPKTVDMGVSKQHCKLIIADDGTMTLCNINPDNETMWNGLSIERKRFELNDDTDIRLGQCGYRLPLKEVLKQLGVKNIYSIAHLKKIIDEHKAVKMKLQIQQGRQNAFRSMGMVLIPLSSLLGFTNILPSDSLRYVSTFACFIFGIYSIYKGYVSASKNPKIQMELDNKYHKECICPNPDCGHFLPGEYDDILKAGACPWCRSKFKE